MLTRTFLLSFIATLLASVQATGLGDNKYSLIAESYTNAVYEPPSLAHRSAKALELPAFSSTPYVAITSHLVRTTLPPPLQAARIANLATYTPFCLNTSAIDFASLGIRREGERSGVEECMRWEEMELDMLLMYLDLLAVGMKRALAEQFYRQIRCLSRANLRVEEGDGDGNNNNIVAWQVCFEYDYSEMVGTLLSYYINEDFKLNPPVKNDDDNVDNSALINPATRFVQVDENNRGRYLLSVFSQASSFRIYSPLAFSTASGAIEQRKQTSCCEECTDDNYFVNIERDQCLKAPFDNHCCHKACKALGRLKVGVHSSISYCCAKCSPLPCKTN